MSPVGAAADTLVKWILTPAPAEAARDLAAFGGLLLPLVLAELHRSGRRVRRAGAFTLAVSLVVVILGVSRIGAMAREGVRDPAESDFLAFWFPARVAAQGLDFYDPGNYAAFASSEYTGDFNDEILGVGFWYPPPSMLIALPIGRLPLHRAALLWQSLVLASLAAAVLLLWRTFLSGSGARGLLACSALVLLFRSTFTTLAYTQTNFLELALLIAFWRDRDRARGGVWLALAIVTKPFALALVAFLAIRRRWSGIAATVAALTVLVLTAVLVFGADVTASYVRSNPIARLPAHVYVQDVNQSLSGVILRARDLEVHPLAAPVRGQMLIAGFIILALTLRAALRRALDERLNFGLVLITALMLYPVSLAHYSVVLLLPLMMLWSGPDSVPGGRITLAIGIAIMSLLIGAGFEAVFWAYAALWLALLAVAMTAPRADRVHPAAAGGHPLRSEG